MLDCERKGLKQTFSEGQNFTNSVHLSHYVFTSIMIDPPGGETAVPRQAGAAGDDREQDDRGDHCQVPAIRHVQV